MTNKNKQLVVTTKMGQLGTKTYKLMVERQLVLGRPSVRFDHLSIIPTNIGLPPLSSEEHDMKT